VPAETGADEHLANLRLQAGVTVYGEVEKLVAHRLV
jgi:hypothetical protein